MHPQAKQALVSRLIRIADGVVHNQPISDFPARTFFTGNNAFTIASEAFHEYTGLCKQLLRERGWAAKFSEEFVNNVVTKALMRVVSDAHHDNISQYVDEMVAEFEDYHGEQIVLVMVDGVSMQFKSLQFGPVVLRRITDDYIGEHVRNAAPVITEKLQTQEEKDVRIEQRRQVLRDNLLGKVCVEYRVEAEPIRAEQRAIEMCRRVIDILRYALPAILPDVFFGSSYILSEDSPQPAGQAQPMTETQQQERDERRQQLAIGLRGEVQGGVRETSCIAADSTTYSYTTRVTGPRVGVVINGLTETIMQSLGVFEVAALLGKEDRTEFEQRILRGVHWFANALVQIERENELTSLVTVLETFLAPGESDRISNKIAEGVAFLLTEDPDERLALRDRVKELYTLRSKVSHGSPIPFTSDDLDQLTNIVMEFLQCMIQVRAKFQTAKALNEWIDRQRFHGGWGNIFSPAPQSPQGA